MVPDDSGYPTLGYPLFLRSKGRTHRMSGREALPISTEKEIAAPLLFIQVMKFAKHAAAYFFLKEFVV